MSSTLVHCDNDVHNNGWHNVIINNYNSYLQRLKAANSKN